MEIAEVIRKTKLALLFTGVKEDTGSSTDKLINKCLFYFNTFWLYSDVIAEIFWLVEAIKLGISIEDISILAPCMTVSILSTAKMGPLYFNRGILIESVNKLNDLNAEFDEEVHIVIETEKKERDIVRNSKLLLNNVIVLMTYVCYVVVIVFSCMPVISMCYDYYEEGETEYKLPFLVRYFFDPFTRTRWPFVYFHQIWSTVIAAINVFASDTLFYVYCVCIDMHFQILSLRLEHVFASPLSSCDMTLKFKTCLRRHQELILLVDQVEILYSKSLLFNIITSSFLICLSGFNITSLDDTGAVVAFITFLFMSLSQISLLCYFGDLLMKSSATVSNAIYESHWYIMHRQIRSSVLFVITRAQKPCKLTAWKFADLNLSAFTTILSRSWSYFVFLRTIYE